MDFRVAVTTSKDAPVAANQVMELYAGFFGHMGITCAMAFSAIGASYGTAKSGTGIGAMSVIRPDMVMKSLIPVIMAGIITIYGLVVAVVLNAVLSSSPMTYTPAKGFVQLGAGMSVGLCGMGAGYAIGQVGYSGVTAIALQPRFFVGMVLILIFAEVLGLYGLIVALILNSSTFITQE